MKGFGGRRRGGSNLLDGVVFVLHLQGLEADPGNGRVRGGLFLFEGAAALLVAVVGCHSLLLISGLHLQLAKWFT